MNKILPTGAVIKCENLPFLIVGYKFLKTESRIEIGYSAVMYPLGIKDGESVVTIPESKVGAVLHCPDKLKTELTVLLEKICQNINEEGWESVEKQLREVLLNPKLIGEEV